MRPLQRVVIRLTLNYPGFPEGWKMNRFKIYRWLIGGYWGKKDGEWVRITQGDFFIGKEFTEKEDHGLTY